MPDCSKCKELEKRLQACQKQNRKLQSQMVQLEAELYKYLDKAEMR